MHWIISDIFWNMNYMSLSLTILLFYLVTKAVILTIWCHLYCQTTKKCCTFHYFYILIIVECVQRIKCKPFCRLQYTFQVINILQSLTSENDSRYEASITLLVPVQIKSKSFKSWTKYQILSLEMKFRDFLSAGKNISN